VRAFKKEIFVNELVASKHHCHILEGDKKVIVPILLEFFEETLKFKTRGNPDYYRREYESFGISDGRTVKEMQSRKNLDSGRQIFVLMFEFITHEAQNSLLKVLEEPSSGTYFFIIVPRATIFLQTVLSRAHLISLEGDRKSLVNVSDFLSAKSPLRVKMLEKIIEEKNKSEAISFLHELLRVMYKEHKNPQELGNLAEIEKCSEYLYDRGSSVKMILEYLALTIPRQGA